MVVPARNEEESLPNLFKALARQRDLHGDLLDARTYEVLLLLNNCSDHSAEIARRAIAQFSSLRLHVAEVAFEGAEAHVGKARQTLFDTAFQRFASVSRKGGLILTTDADSRPADDWIAQNEAEIAAGVDAVGGRITIERDEIAALPAGVARFLVTDIGYRRALEELRSLYAPEAHDPFPRHHQHFGGSLAVTSAAYGRAGGMPLRRSSEDAALVRAIEESGGRIRHSYRVRVFTSARMVGRAQGGLADALSWWNAKTEEATPVLVESASAAADRLAQLGLWRLAHPNRPLPLSLHQTPEPPHPAEASEIQMTLRGLRTIIARLRKATLAARLEEAEKRFAKDSGPELPVLAR